MPLIDDILDLVSHPAVQPILHQAVMGSPTDALEQRLTQAELRLDEFQRDQKRRQKKTPTAAGGVALVEVRDQVSGISGRLDEALRFAREGGIRSPEASKRLDDARAQVLELERYSLMPEQAATPEERRAAQDIAPRVRHLRQKILNRMWSVEDLEEASASAGGLLTAVQTLIMARSAARTRRDAPSAGTSDDALRRMGDDGGYGREGLSKGCIPCAMGHLGMAAGSLSRAVKSDPTEQAKRVAMVQKELDMLLAYDWTPEKIAQNTPEEQQVILHYQPRIEELRRRVAAIGGPEDVTAVSEETVQLWRNFSADVEKLPAPAHYGRRAKNHTVEAIHDADAKIDRVYQSYGFIAPSRRDLQREAERTNYGEIMDRVVDKTKNLLGVQWLTQPLFGEDALYIPATNTIIRTAEATFPENYHLQTTIHESAHALLQNPRCFPGGLVTPRAREIGETEADLVTIAAMSELGLPLEYGDGTREGAGDYTVDWQAVRQHFGPEMEQRVHWAAGWLLEAAQNGNPSGTCPLPAVVPVPPTIAPGVSRPVGTGLEVPKLPNTALASGPTEGSFGHPSRGVINIELQSFKDRFAQLKTRNSANVEKQVRRFADLGVENADDVLDAIEEYRGIDRADYSDPEDYQDARTEAWEAVEDAVDNMFVPEQDGGGGGYGRAPFRLRPVETRVVGKTM